MFKAARRKRSHIGMSGSALASRAGQPALRATACITKVLSRRTVPYAYVLSSSRKAARPARAAQLPDTRRRGNQGKAMPAPAVQPHTGQVADQIANTPRN